jgi:hypothetical protein
MIGIGTPSSQRRIPLPMISSLYLLRCENSVVRGKGRGDKGRPSLRPKSPDASYCQSTMRALSSAKSLINRARSTVLVSHL